MEAIWQSAIWQSASFVLFFLTVPIPAECSPSVYNELSEANRYWSYDDGIIYLYKDYDTIISGQWYRFTGGAGTMLPTYCIPKYSCNTIGTAWISDGDHPTAAYELVSRTVCMHSHSSCCQTSYPVEIRNCSGYYVYKLKRPPDMRYRYCGVNGKYILEQISITILADYRILLDGMAN